MSSITNNPHVRIGNEHISVAGIRRLKSDVDGVEKLENGDIKINENLKKQLNKDGYDEIIFKKGDELFIAYQKNMDLDGIKFNMETASFDPDSAYESGQMSVNGDAVQVLAIDDENQESFWVAPYKSMGRGLKSMVNHPMGRTAIVGFGIGATTVLVGKNIGDATKAFNGTLIGGGVAGVASGLKAGFEQDLEGYWDTGIGIAATAGGAIVGGATAHFTQELVKSAIQNPKVAGITLGASALFVGTGLVVDMLSDDNKPATMRVLDRISE